MKVVQHEALGDPAEVLKLVERPSRAPGPGEVRVQVLATPIHPSNLLQIAGLYGTKPSLPAIPGAEGVGRVVEVGEGVTALSVGQRVLLTAGQGTWRSELVAPAARLIPLPSEGDAEQLAMLMVNPMTAWLLLTSIVDLGEGDWIVQSAANSAVGEYLIQLAKRAGVRTVNVVRRRDVVESLEKLGADAVVVDGPDLGARIREAAGGRPIRLGIDAVAGDTLSALLSSLGPQGTLVSYGAMSMQPASIHPGRLVFDDLKVRGFWLSRWFQTASEAERSAAFGALIPLIASGRVSATIDSRFPLEAIRDAVTRAAAGGRSGKVLLVPEHG